MEVRKGSHLVHPFGLVEWPGRGLLLQKWKPGSPSAIEPLPRRHPPRQYRPLQRRRELGRHENIV